MGDFAVMLKTNLRPSRAHAASLAFWRTAFRSALLGGALASGTLLAMQPAAAQQGGSASEGWASCLEAVVALQKQLKETQPRPAQPQTETQSIAAQDSAQPTPGSLAAAGMDVPMTGAWGALNEAINLQASGNEQGCFQAVDKARALAAQN